MGSRARVREPLRDAGGATGPPPRAGRGSHPGMPAARRARLHADRLRNRPAGLATSLRAAGQGAMEPLEDRLLRGVAPTLVIAGALDAAGRARATDITARIPGARLAIVENAGHTPHLETPVRFRTLAAHFLEED